MNRWREVTIGEIARVQSGSGFPKRYQGETAGDCPFFKVSDMNLPGNERFMMTANNYVSEGTRVELGAKVFPIGSIIFPKIGAAIATNKKRVVAQACCVDNNVMGVVPVPDEVYPDFLFYWFVQHDLSEFANNSELPSIRKTAVEAHPLVLPRSLPEQELIVAILDEAFAAIATATANAEKNLANALELFDAYFLRVFSAKAEEWPRRTLAELLELGWIADHMDGNHGGDYPRKHEFIDAGVPYISANCLTNDAIDMEKAKHLSPKRAAKLRKGFAESGDVLFAHNATVGPVAILETREDTVILGTSLTYYRCNPEFIYPQYLAHYMRSSEFVRQYSLVMRQSTRNQVPITKQREFAHVVPPIDRQHELAASLDDVLQHRKTLAAVYDKKISLLAEPKQSILRRALTGELTSRTASQILETVND